MIAILSLVALGLGSLCLGIMLGVGYQRKRSAEEAALLVAIWEKINFVQSEVAENNRKFEEIYCHLNGAAQEAEDQTARLDLVESDVRNLKGNSPDCAITQVLPKIDLD